MIYPIHKRKNLFEVVTKNISKHVMAVALCDEQDAKGAFCNSRRWQHVTCERCLEKRKSIAELHNAGAAGF